MWWFFFSVRTGFLRHKSKMTVGISRSVFRGSWASSPSNKKVFSVTRRDNPVAESIRSYYNSKLLAKYGRGSN
jgi:hypothetical protein